MLWLSKVILHYASDLNVKLVCTQIKYHIQTSTKTRKLNTLPNAWYVTNHKFEKFAFFKAATSLVHELWPPQTKRQEPISVDDLLVSKWETTSVSWPVRHLRWNDDYVNLAPVQKKKQPKNDQICMTFVRVMHRCWWCECNRTKWSEMKGNGGGECKCATAPIERE